MHQDFHCHRQTGDINNMKKENKKKLKEIRGYINRQLYHIGHHCCSIPKEEHNKIIDMTYELEEINEC